MLITKKYINRRTLLRGIGATVGLPFLEAMVSAMPSTRTPSLEKTPIRLACVEMVHGSAGATNWGATQNMWSPVKAGGNFDLSPSSLQPL